MAEIFRTPKTDHHGMMVTCTFVKAPLAYISNIYRFWRKDLFLEASLLISVNHILHLLQQIGSVVKAPGC